MAAADIFPLDPDYTVSQPWSAGLIEAMALSGRRQARQAVHPARRQFRLLFRQRPTSEKLILEDWYRRFERDFFNFHHKVWAVNELGNYIERYFAVEFAGPPEIALVANEAYDMEVTLIEAVGRALFQYPDPVAGHPSVFFEEDALSKTQGTWALNVLDSAHGGSDKSNANANTVDFALWVYAGYGFRVWARKQFNHEIFEVLLDDTSLGNIDLYSATTLGTQPVFTKLDVVLGVHRVKLRATNTRNPNATPGGIVVDALEYLL